MRGLITSTVDVSLRKKGSRRECTKITAVVVLQCRKTSVSHDEKKKVLKL